MDQFANALRLTAYLALGGPLISFMGTALVWEAARRADLYAGGLADWDADWDADWHADSDPDWDAHGAA